MLLQSLAVEVSVVCSLITIHILIQPNMPVAWQIKQVMICFEMSVLDARKKTLMELLVFLLRA